MITMDHKKGGETHQDATSIRQHIVNTWNNVGCKTKICWIEVWIFFNNVESNTFLNYKVVILRNNFKLRVVIRLIDKSINLNVEYQVSLVLIGIYLVYLQKLQETSFFLLCM
jgi:hypothetical protein